MCLNVMMVDGQNSFTFTQKWPTFCFDLLKLCIYLTLKIIAKKTFLQPHPLFSKVNQKKLSKGESNNICAMFFKQNKQARVAQLVACRLVVPEIRVQTPPGAN